MNTELDKMAFQMYQVFHQSGQNDDEFLEHLRHTNYKEYCRRVALRSYIAAEEFLFYKAERDSE